MTTMNEYQRLARKTALYPEELGLYYTALGLTGEAGEVAEKVKTMIRDDKTIEDCQIDIMNELGDVMWYIANVAYEFGLTLEEVAENNVLKLNSRLERNVIHGNGDNR
jgi:NTP pyrophosphatase (non-canonical NTP hydrolase)